MIHPTEHQAIISSPVGKVGMAFENAQLIHLDLLPESTPLKAPDQPHTKQVANELAQYFVKPSHRFNIDFKLQGTPFQCRVWQALSAIPPGETLTYGQLATKLGTAPRAIGQACRTNPFVILIPCHRIVGAQDIGGYSGARHGLWLDVKKWLLHHESAIELRQQA